MGFRNPATTATAVDTGRGLSDAGVRLFQDLSVPAVPRGVAEWRTGLMDANATVALAGGGSGGSAFTIYGGATQLTAAPALALNVEAQAAGGYAGVARLKQAASLDLGGADVVNIGSGGWQPLTPAAGFTAAGDCTYLRRAGWATVLLTLLASSGWPANAPLLATPLPAGVAPQKLTQIPANISGDSTRWALTRIQPSGQIVVVPAVTGGNDLRVAFTFPTV